MIIKSCPKCDGPGRIRSEQHGKMYEVWIECEGCGYHTRRFYDSQPPREQSTGAKFAALVWNSDITRPR